MCVALKRAVGLVFFLGFSGSLFAGLLGLLGQKHCLNVR